jgi:hypothetical protein
MMRSAKGPENWTSTSLQDALLQTQFSLQTRLRCGVTLASSVLQLSNTPWLKENWGKEDIFFIHRPATSSYEDLFITSNLYNTNKYDHVTNSPISRIIRNETLYALGLILIELWYRKTIRQLHIEEDGPIETNEMNIKTMTTWNTADRLTDELYTEAGQKYADAVRRCIRCDFGLNLRSLKDAIFVRAVYDTVMRPLQENFDMFLS